MGAPRTDIVLEEGFTRDQLSRNQPRRRFVYLAVPDRRREGGNVRFARSIRGIDHHVQEIAVKSTTEVEVKTGRISPDDWEKDRNGDSALLRKVDGHWTVIEQSSWSYPAEKDPIYIWDGTSELAIVAAVTDSVTHKPIFGATITGIRAGHDTEPLTNEHPAKMPPPQKTSRGGRATLHAYFRAAGIHSGFSVFVGNSFLRVDALGYQPQEVRLSPLGRLDFAPKTKNCEVTVPIALTH